jgi:hypothetical protein
MYCQAATRAFDAAGATPVHLDSASHAADPAATSSTRHQSLISTAGSMRVGLSGIIELHRAMQMLCMVRVNNGVLPIR